jgi:DNA-directed RNA polymerase specialized sigma24 family protein
MSHECGRETSHLKTRMNVELLRLQDVQEWQRSGTELWSLAFDAARKSLFYTEYSEADGKDVAQKTLKEFWENGIGDCHTESDVEGWIRRRACARAADLRRWRRRRREVPTNEQPELDLDGQPADGGPPQPLPEQLTTPPVEMSEGARADELLALARSRGAGFSKLEQAAFLEVFLYRASHEDFAQKYNLKIGSVGNIVNRAKRKMIDILTGHERIVNMPSKRIPRRGI